MSIPHTGKLTAKVDGKTCQFDGDRWITPDAELTARLNDATDSSPKTHFSITEIAENVLHKLGLERTSIIESAEADTWKEGIPDDAID